MLPVTEVYFLECERRLHSLTYQMMNMQVLVFVLLFLTHVIFDDSLDNFAVKREGRN